MLTYTKLLELSQKDDPLVDPDFPDNYEITDEGLVLFGNNKNGYMSDLKIKINIDGTLTAWLRDPKDCDAESSFHGTAWCEESRFGTFDALHTWAYSW